MLGNRFPGPVYRMLGQSVPPHRIQADTGGVKREVEGANSQEEGEGLGCAPK